MGFRACLLSTKSLNASQRQLATSMGFEVKDLDFIRTRSLLDEMKTQRILQLAETTMFALLTSPNAVRRLLALLKAQKISAKGWRFFCINGKTYELLRSYFSEDQILAKAKDAVHLAPLILEWAPQEIVFFSGKKRRDFLPAVFLQEQIALEEIVLYDTVATPKALTSDFDFILFYSPSGLHSFLEKNTLPDRGIPVAIGHTTESAIRALFPHRSMILTADFPSPERMLELVNHYLLTHF